MKMPGNMQAMMQQAQKMQQKMQEEVARIQVEAVAGGGAVNIPENPYAPSGEPHCVELIRLTCRVTPNGFPDSTRSPTLGSST